MDGQKKGVRNFASLLLLAKKMPVRWNGRNKAIKRSCETTTKILYVYLHFILSIKF
jgi:hypothetical protein